MKLLTFLFAAITTSASALTIQIDYRYDTIKFFTPERKQVIESVAKFYGDLIKDNLLRIDRADFPGSSWSAAFFNPQTGVQTSIPSLVVPADTMIVYVGARDFPGSTLGQGGPGGYSNLGGTNFFNRVVGRGNAGALATPETDHAPWGGFISFDLEGPWNFSQTQNASGFEFVIVALHEMGHVLGIGTCDSWDAKAVGGFFTGAASTRSYGSNPPLQSGNDHFAQATAASRSFGSFSRAHGINRPVTMIPSLTDDGTNFDVVSDLDLAGLIDCGWEISPPLKLASTSLSLSASSFSWNSSSFLNYKLQRSINLENFPDGSEVFAGNGSVQTWADIAPPIPKAFYRLAAVNADVVSGLVARQPAAFAVSRSAGGVTSFSEEPRCVTGCCGSEH